MTPDEWRQHLANAVPPTDEELAADLLCPDELPGLRARLEALVAKMETTKHREWQ